MCLFTMLPLTTTTPRRRRLPLAAFLFLLPPLPLTPLPLSLTGQSPERQTNEYFLHRPLFHQRFRPFHQRP